MSCRMEWDRLLVAARGGDGQALGALLEATHADLFAAAATVLGHSARRALPVDDVFAEAMIAALRELRSLRATNYLGFRFWFVSIARNHVCRAIRREQDRPRMASEPDCDDEQDGERARDAESADQVYVCGALPRLPKTQQIAFVLREGLELSWPTIGFVLERRQTPAARLIHYRAVQRLKYVLNACADLRPLPEMQVAEA